MLIKHKNVFGKCFVSKIFSKIQKFSTLTFGDSLASHASCEAPVASLLGRFHDSLANETSSCEKHLENFSKLLGFGHFRNYFMSGSQVASLLREVRDSLASGCPSREKDLDKVFKILYKGFWRLVLATCSRVI